MRFRDADSNRLVSIRVAMWTAFLLVFRSGHDSCAGEKDLVGDTLPPGAVARLGTLRLRDSSVLHAISYFPDGRRFITASGSIRIWDAADGRSIRELLRRPSNAIDSLTLSPDGRTLVFPEGDTMKLVDAGNGKVLRGLGRHKWFADCAAYSPDGKVVASGGRDGMIRFCDVETGKELRAVESPDVSYLSYTPDGKAMLSTSWRGRKCECRLWDLESAKLRRRWSDVGEPIALSPDGKVVAAGVKPSRLQLFDVATFVELQGFDLPRDPILPLKWTPFSRPRSDHPTLQVARCAAFSRNGKMVAAGDMENVVHVWEAASGRELFRSKPYDQWVTCLSFSPDGNTLAVGAWQRIFLLDATTGRLGSPESQVGRVALSPDAKTVLTQGEDGTIVWDPRSGRERRRWSNRRFIAYSPDGDMLLQEKGSIVLCEASTKKTLHTFKVYGAGSSGGRGIWVAFSHDGKKMVSGSMDRTIRMWDPVTGEEHWRARRTDTDRRFPADIGGHWPLGFTHDDKSIVTLADDAVIRVWDAATGKQLRWFRIDSSEADLSRDGRFIVAVGRHVAAPDGRSEGGGAAPARLFDLAEVGKPKPIQLYSKPAGRAIFSPDGRIVAVSDGAEIVLIERASGKEIRRLKGHEADVLDLAFSEDGRLLVSGSRDLTALVWDVR